MMFFHILVLQELGSGGKQNNSYAGARGVRIVALSITSHEQTLLNRVCCFLILLALSISEGFFFPGYFELLQDYKMHCIP